MTDKELLDRYRKLSDKKSEYIEVLSKKINDIASLVEYEPEWFSKTLEEAERLRKEITKLTWDCLEGEKLDEKLEKWD